MATGSQRQRMRPAHAPGPTFLSYTPNGRQLVTIGANSFARVFTTGSNREPLNVDECSDSNTALVATNHFFITGAEDGSVCKFSLDSRALDQILVRCTLPIRDLALSRDEEWVAVASDELVVKVVNTTDMTRVLYLREQPKSVKHVSFDHSGNCLAVSGTDGILYMYNMNLEQPELVRKVEGLIRSLEPEDSASSKIAWHPDGRAFAAPTATRDIQVMSRRDWERQRAFTNGHTGDVTALAWSPNGAMLATAGAERKICLWETKTQKIIKRYDEIPGMVLAFSWHPTENILSYTDDEGRLYIHTDFVPSEHMDLLEVDLEPAPFIHDPLKEASGNRQRLPELGAKGMMPLRPHREATPDSLDDILGPNDDGMSDVDGFIVDDETGADGVTVHGSRKRTSGHFDAEDLPRIKRRAYATWQPQKHHSFQPGSTPWRGNRRYLCVNLIGVVWTVDQDTHHTVTVEFYDREFHRDFHFTDPYSYDKACITEKGTLFSNQPAAEQQAVICYRPHESWTTRTDWRVSLPEGEEIAAIALSELYIVVTTSADYVRVFSLFGTPISVYRQKNSPIVTCACWRDYVMTVGNGAVCGDGTTRLQYTIENLKRDEVCQSEDVVPLSEGASIRNVFFSDTGDPHIYDSDGVLLVLMHWRTPGQAKWVPVLDTRQLDRLADGRKEETYWPVAVAQEKFYCIILKGGDRHPYFPRPLLSEFELRIPLHVSSSPNAATDDGDVVGGSGEVKWLEEAYVRSSVLHSLQNDTLQATHATSAQKAEISRRALEIDKLLLQLLAAECLESEDAGMKALEIVRLMRDESGRMMEAASKVAARFGKEVLGEKIRELAESRLVGLDDGV